MVPLSWYIVLSAVMFSIGPSTSAWLSQGDEFRGWIVGEITPSGVTLSKDDRSLVLRPS